MRLMAALAAAMLATGHVSAQSDTFISVMAGRYQILPTNGFPLCTIRLTAGKQDDGWWRAWPDADCAEKVPSTRDVDRWRFADGMLAIAAGKKVRLTFVEDETTLLASPDFSAPVLYLIPAVKGFTRLPQTAEMTGRWQLRKGSMRCILGLTGTATVRATTGCKGQSRKLRSWRIDGISVLLSDDDDLFLSFTPAGDGLWQSSDGWRLERAAGS